jgi:integrase
MAKRQGAKGQGYIFKRGNVYYLQYDVNKKRHLKSLRTGDEREAQKRAKELLNPTLHSTDKAHVIENIAKARKVIQAASIKLTDVWKCYLKAPAKLKPNSSEGTLGNYKRNWEQFVDWLNTNHPSIIFLSDQIDKNILTDYENYLESLKLADTTYNYKIGTLKLVARILKEEAGLNSTVWEKLTRIKNPERMTKQYFTFNESVKLLEVFDALDEKENPIYFNKKRGKQIAEKYQDVLNSLAQNQLKEKIATLQEKEHELYKDQMRVLFAIGIYSGMRLADCVNLKWSNITNLENGVVIKCKPIKTRKFKKEIIAPVVSPLQGFLKIANDWKNPTDYITPDIAERYHRNPTGIKQDVVRVFKLAGYTTSKTKDGADKKSRKYSTYGFHSLRHSLFSYLCHKGITIEKLASWSGDSEETLLKYYLHSDAEKLIKEAENAITANDFIDIVAIPAEPLAIAENEPERIQLIELVKTMSLDKVKQMLATEIKG